MVSLRARIWTLIVVGLLVIVAAVPTIRARYLSVQGAAREVSQVLQPAADSVATITESIAEMDSAVSTYAVTADVTDLRYYVEGGGRTQRQIGMLATTLGDEPALLEQLLQIERSLAAWRTEGTRPIIEATRAGQYRLAEELIRSGESRGLYNDVRSHTHALDDDIDAQIEAAVEEQNTVLDELAWALNITSGLTILVLLFAMVLLFRWVLRPLDQLRAQLREVARRGSHETPIRPTGPPELQAAGRDAEAMRRHLVAEIDEARAAREGLEQQTPVVSAIREELAAAGNNSSEDFEIYGNLQPAEGVVAGDWWAVTTLADGRVGLAVTDVSGHGPAAGMEALRLKYVIGMSMARDGDPAVALQRAAAGFTTASRFATTVILTIDPATGEITWANAGHIPPWIVGSGDRFELEATGPLLSKLGGSWQTRTTRLSPEELLLIWTDGLTESHDQAHMELSDDGLNSLLSRALDQERTVEGIVTNILAAARARAIDWRRDDVTLVGIRRRRPT